VGRLPSWPVWLIAVGGIVVVFALLGVYQLVGFTADTASALARVGAKNPAVALLVLLGLGGGIVFCVGVVAYVIRGSLSHELAMQGYASLGTILACFGAATIVANILTLPYFLSGGSTQVMGAMALTATGLTVAAVAMELSLLGVVYLRIVHPVVFSWEQLGLIAPRLSPLVSAGFLVGAAAIAGSFALTAALEQLGIHQTQQDLFAGVLGATPAQFVGLLLTVGVLVPICEEIFFRGYIFTAVHQRYGLTPAFIASSLLFALAHANVQAFLPLLFVGATFCYVYWRTGSLVPSMLAHGINNALALAALYFSR
jgi:membrane protease YdiL (CAAX protease family)